jgi:hypothetical protein
VSKPPAVVGHEAVEDRHEFHDAGVKGEVFGILGYRLELHCTSAMEKKDMKYRLPRFI